MLSPKYSTKTTNDGKLEQLRPTVPGNIETYTLFDVVTINYIELDC